MHLLDAWHILTLRIRRVSGALPTVLLLLLAHVSQGLAGNTAMQPFSDLESITNGVSRDAAVLE